MSSICRRFEGVWAETPAITPGMVAHPAQCCIACSAFLPTSTSSAARSSTTSGRPSRCCCSCASTRSGWRGCGSPPPRSCSRSGGGRGARWRGSTAGRCVAWGAVLALMNCCFYLAIDRLPLATVAAIEFLPVVGLAAARRAHAAQRRRAAARGAGRVPAHRDPARGRAAGRRAGVRQRRAVRALHRARPPGGAGRGRRRARRRDARRRRGRDAARARRRRCPRSATRSPWSPASASGSPRR